MDPASRARFEALFPDRLVAACSREQAERLAPFDFHCGRVAGRLGVLLTYEGPDPGAAEGPLVLTVVFRYAERHPPVPPEVQAIVDRLVFAPPR